MEKDERTVYCPRCGNMIKRTDADVEHYKGLEIVVYDMCCDKCGTTIGIEDRSSFEQEGRIIVIFV